ncbi:MAG: PTS sugar transporter subunit IIA, partial [Phycisphaerales bacterium]|nr:PTS sugar transporter subunit IIA [Phycisphaerales bacterium]
LFTVAIVLLCLVWYFHYAVRRVRRHGAIYHWFNRLGQRRFDGLDREFRGIMKEKGLRDDDPFDQIVARSLVIDLVEPTTFENAVELAAERLSHRVPHTIAEIRDRFLQGTLTGHTPVTDGVALPHFRTVSIEIAEMVLVRARHPIAFPADDPLTPQIESDKNVTALFFLVSPDENPAQHLRILAQIAGRVDEDSFAEAWAAASNERELREVLLRDDRFATIDIVPGAPTMALAGTAIGDVALPPHCLIAVIRRDEDSIIPRSDTVLQPGDRITVIGQPEGIVAFRTLFEAPTSDTERMPATIADGERGGAFATAAALSPEVVGALTQRLLYLASRSVDREPQRARECLDALGRLAAGRYGFCVDCGQSIQPHWLMLRPDDLRCLHCHHRPPDAGTDRTR